MKVVFTDTAEESLGRYYEGYDNLPTGGTDLEQRSDNYRKIVRILGNIDDHLNQTYIKNGRNLIYIGNIGTVEYQILQTKGWISIKNIYFNKSKLQRRIPQYKPVSQECYGLTMVQSAKGLFNYVDRNKKLFCKQWYQKANNFQKYSNGYVAAKVFDGYNWYWLDLSSKILYKTTQNSMIPENRRLNRSKMITESANRNDILRAMKGNHLCAVTTYESKVPGYGSVPNTRYGVVLCFGTGRYQGEPAIRFYQTKPKNASWGQNQKPPQGSYYKILYLKDIVEFHVLQNTITNPPPLFNPQDDKWFRTDAKRIVANFNDPANPIIVGGGATTDQTETEKSIEQDMQIPAISVKNKYDRLRKTTNELKGTYTIVNNMMMKLQKDEKSGKRVSDFRKKTIQALLEKTQELFTKSQSMTNKYWGIYRTEMGNKNISISNRKKTSTEKKIKNKLDV